MQGEELVAFLHSDISGLNRGRSVPATELDERFAAGVGWVPADQALTPFGPIAEPNPFGSLGDLRLLPDRETRVRVDLWDDASPLHFFFCDAVNTDGSPWDACPRTLLKGALSRLEGTGFRLISSFEQEFILAGLGSEPGPGFSLEAQRFVEPFGPLVLAALRQAGLQPEVFLPEYGEGQYEVPCAPAEGVSGADRAAAMREVVREVARRLGYRASFVPKADPEGVGNGVHIHLSLLDLEGRPAFYDPERPGRLSAVGARFAAGILEHLPALCAFTAPSVVSYLRLVPHFWSAGFGCLGERNRETAIRIPPIVELSSGDPAPVQPRVSGRRRGGVSSSGPCCAHPRRFAGAPRRTPRAGPGRAGSHRARRRGAEEVGHQGASRLAGRSSRSSRVGRDRPFLVLERPL